MSCTVIDIGASLAAARADRGLSLVDAGRLTCIRPRYLEALERGAFDMLPGRTYARAFLRTYAAALGLDANLLVDAFEELVPEPVDDWLPSTPLRRRRAFPLLRPALAITAAVSVVAVVAWTSSPRSTLQPLPSPVPAAVDRPDAATAGVLGKAHTIVKRPPSGLVVRALRGDCWLLVRRGGPAGGVLYEGTLRRGHALRFGAPRVWVRLGAPGMATVSRAGKQVQGLAGLTPVNIVA